jgi:hypothetical protein
MLTLQREDVGIFERFGCRHEIRGKSQKPNVQTPKKPDQTLENPNFEIAAWRLFWIWRLAFGISAPSGDGTICRG